MTKVPSQTTSDTAAVDAIVIGRNEGQRLVECLLSLQSAGVRRVVYVDSGSLDGSPDAALAQGAEVVPLDMTRPFTAARARNAGIARINELPEPPRFVQFVDGDCVVQPGWIATARDFLLATPLAVAVCGRRRERFPNVSVYNRLCDREWDTPIGEATACGGDVLMRLGPLTASGGYREDLIAGEEPELCLRLRRAGGQIWRIAHEMTLHDAAMTRFSQWWKRSRRAGHAFAEGAAIHGKGPERHWVAETRRALLWGAILPAVIVLAAAIAPALAALLLMIYPAQIVRLAARTGLSRREAWQNSFYAVIGKFAEAQGVLSYWLNRARGRGTALIEYK